MPKKKYTLREKICLECGKMHTSRRYCSLKCGEKFRNRNNKPKTTKRINSIIYGTGNEVQSDQGYGFVFSNDIKDWTRGVNLRSNDSRKLAYHRNKVENSKIETNTVNLN